MNFLTQGLIGYFSLVISIMVIFLYFATKKETARKVYKAIIVITATYSALTLYSMIFKIFGVITMYVGG